MMPANAHMSKKFTRMHFEISEVLFMSININIICWDAGIGYV